MRELQDYLGVLRAEAQAQGRPIPERMLGELADHWEELQGRYRAEGFGAEAASQKAIRELGEPRILALALKTDFPEPLAFWRRFFRPAPLAATFLLLLGWTVNSFAFSLVSIQGRSVEPRLSPGNHAVVEKWRGPLHPEDLVVFRAGDRLMLGIVDGWSPDGRLEVHRNGSGPILVDPRQLLGRVVLRIP